MVQPPAEPEDAALSERDLLGILKPHRSIMRRGYLEGERRYGRFALSFPAFASRVFELTRRRLRDARVPDYPARIAHALREVVMPDLYLAIACHSGDSHAWNILMAHHFTSLRRYVIRQGASEAEASDLLQNLVVELYAPTADETPGVTLGTYCGRGSLRSFLKIAVRRRFVDLCRRAERRSLQRDGRGGGSFRDEGGDLWASPADPASIVSDREVCAILARELRAALGQLSPRQRLALRLRYEDNLLQKEIGRVLGVKTSRANKILKQAEGELRRRILPELERMLGEGGVGAPLLDRLESPLRDVLQREMENLRRSHDFSSET